MALPDLAALQRALSVSFNDSALLGLALIHSSYLNENPGFSSTSNERLEFLGDAVLGLVVGERLYSESPDFSEGELTRLRAAIVRGETLAEMARIVELGSYLYLGKGEEASGGRNKTANLSGALEAIIGAVYLDQGLAVARDLVLRLVEPAWENVARRGTQADFKSRLQELVQLREQQTPSYQVVEVSGPDHDRTFTVEVRLGGRVLGQGVGKSKKVAETEAARAALEKLGGNA